ncbi:MAG TPA: radical SAM protein [Polyangia bacterium]|nr:radical SAM protein [Polyangia bacterium]
MKSKLSYYFEMGCKVRPLHATPKLWNYVKYRSLARTARTSIRRYTPQIASVLVTKRCNLNCGYCFVRNVVNQQGTEWREGEATLDKIRRIFCNPLFDNCLLVDLQGGEPLLVDDLEAIVSYLVGRGHIVNTSTNGLLLAERIAGLKRAGISRINVSLYDTNRGLIERDLSQINRVFPVHASIVLLRSKVESDADELLTTARFLRAAGCLSLRFWIYRPIEMDPRPDEIIDDALPAYREFRRRMDEALPGFCLWPAAIQKAPFQKLCPQLWQRVGCDVAGNMAICCGTDVTLQGPDSNLFDSAPDSVFNHPTLVAMRERLLDPGREPPDICKTCNLLGEPGW